MISAVQYQAMRSFMEKLIQKERRRGCQDDWRKCSEEMISEYNDFKTEIPKISSKHA